MMETFLRAWVKGYRLQGIRFEAEALPHAAFDRAFLRAYTDWQGHA